MAVLLMLAATSTQALTAQQILSASANLPEAPSFQEAAHPPATAKESSASLTGIVSDIRGGLVQGAEVKLTEKGQPQTSALQATSDSDGHFSFPEIAPGSYTVVISSPGLETFLSPIIVLRPGEKFELPDIALPIASATTSIDVVMTQEQVATEELKLETQQRVLGVFPSFYTTYLWNAAPMNAKQKFKLSFRATTDPIVFLTTGIVAGVEQAHNTFPEYGQGAVGYGKRYGAAFGDAFIGRTLGSAVFPSIFRQDPRYFYMGSGTVRARAAHAIASSFIAKGDNGHWQPNYSHILGNAAAGAISSVYHSDKDGPGKLALDNTLIGLGGNAVNNLIREFVIKRFTTRVPSYAKGKPVTATHP